MAAGLERTLPDWRRRLEAVLARRGGAVRAFPGRGRGGAAGIAYPWRSSARLAPTTSADPARRSAIAGYRAPPADRRRHHQHQRARRDRRRAAVPAHQRGQVGGRRAARGGDRRARGRARRPDAGAARRRATARRSRAGGGEFVSLFPWVAGPHAGARRADARARRRRRARRSPALHLASDGFPTTAPAATSPPEIDARLARIAALAPSRAGAGGRGPGARAGAPARGARRRTCRSGIIHGDLFVDNVLYDDARRADRADRLRAGVVGAPGLRPGGDDAGVRLRPRRLPPRDRARARSTPTPPARPPTDAERAAFGAELRFVACRFAVTRITDVHLKREAGAAPGKNYQRYLDRLASVKTHLAAGDGLFDL